MTVNPVSVLLLVDDPVIQGLVETIIARPEYQVTPFRDVGDALSRFRAVPPDVAIIDTATRFGGGAEVIDSFRVLSRRVPIIALSVSDAVDIVVQSMKAGADDFISKPFDANDLRVRLAKVLERADLARDVDRKRGRLKEHDLYDVVFGCSRKMAGIRSIVDQIADTDVPVLLRGESGTGKDLVARVLYAQSPRAEASFVKVNCAAIPLNLVESELFGYEKGAFTGAVDRKVGKFELANGGTIYLDEIGEIAPVLQSKLLQVLQDGSFSPLGSHRDVQVNMRVISATNLELERAVEDGRFREDLYYRLKVVEIFLPPLRDRLEDIPHIADYFLQQFANQYNRRSMALSKKLLQMMLAYHWPGNIRELENLVKRIVIFGDEAPAIAEIGAKKKAGRSGNLLHVGDGDEVMDLKAFEKRVALQAERLIIEKVLARHGWNRVQTAKYLDVSYKTLLTKIKDCGLHPGHAGADPGFRDASSPPRRAAGDGLQ
ncbi:MAG: sigma-54-dependent Fis family transcriptional regulator [Deltaproteobacteria bacterium]|nr:sigma-54-dependent Fis family transcriptional regulator [Candidatus Anaeroferrophillacea bacterium]